MFLKSLIQSKVQKTLNVSRKQTFKDNICLYIKAFHWETTLVKHKTKEQILKEIQICNFYITFNSNNINEELISSNNSRIYLTNGVFATTRIIVARIAIRVNKHLTKTPSMLTKRNYITINNTDR